MTSDRRAMHWLRDPTIHFFLLGALVFLVHRSIAGDPRTIVVSPTLRTELARRFRDQSGQWPNPAELETALRQWKREEAVYREALHERLDRDDDAVRKALIDKMRNREALPYLTREPSPAELDQWLNQHRDLYERPPIYEFEYATFAKSDPTAEPQCAKFAYALKQGASPSTLKLRTVAAKVNRAWIDQEFGADLAARISGLAPGEWQSLANQERLVLVRMIGIEGGLASPEILRPRMINDWRAHQQQYAMDQAADAIVERYRFVETTQ